MVLHSCIWCYTVAYGVTQLHMVLHSCIWCYTVAYGVTQFHMVRHSCIWCDTVAYGVTQLHIVVNPEDTQLRFEEKQEKQKLERNRRRSTTELVPVSQSETRY